MSGEEKEVSENVAVVSDPLGADAPEMKAYLQAQGIAGAGWYAPRDLNDLDEAVCKGRVRRVVFPHWADLLIAIWNEEIAYETWLAAAGVQVDFGVSPGPAPQAYAQALSQSWADWRRLQRRRQAVAGVLLSAIALVTAFVLVWG